MLYDYLFYKSYKLAKKTKNWEDSPLLLGIMSVGSVITFNVFTIKFLLDIVFGESFDISLGKIKYAIAILLFVLLSFYYKKRWKRIIENYEAREKGKSTHPIIPVLIYVLLSLFLMFLVGMYKHKYWIFS